MKRKRQHAAIMTVHDVGDMTPKGRKAIADWMRKRAKEIEQHGGDTMVDGRPVYASRFTARYMIA